jgi:hypothetical protein
MSMNPCRREPACAALAVEPELIDIDDLDIAGFGVELLDSRIRRFPERSGSPRDARRANYRQPPCYRYRGCALANLGAQDKQHGRLAEGLELAVEVFQDPHIAPQALAGNQARDMREDIVGTVAENIFAVFAKPLARLIFFGQPDLESRDAVVGQVDIGQVELGGHKAKLIDDAVAHGQDVVAEARRIHQAELEVEGLIAEDLVEVQAGLVGLADDIVEHRVVTGVTLDDVPHRGDFVGVEDGLKSNVRMPQGRRHAHELVGDDHARIVRVRRPQGLQRRDRRRSQTHILLVFPQMFIEVAADAELVEHLGSAR